LEATSTLEETDPEEIKSEKGWVAVGGWGWWERERERERETSIGLVFYREKERGD
jgi:hypothetical protein